MMHLLYKYKYGRHTWIVLCVPLCFLLIFFPGMENYEALKIKTVLVDFLDFEILELPGFVRSRQYWQVCLILVCFGLFFV